MNKLTKSDEAFELETQIKELRKGVAFSFLILGRLFKRYRDEKLYLLRDHTTFSSFISSVGFRRPTVYSYIHIYEVYIGRLGLTPENLQDIPYRRLQMINPPVIDAIDKGKDPGEWLDKAKTLSDSDLINELREFKDLPPKEYQPKPSGRPDLFDFDDYEAFVKAFGCILHPGRKAVRAHFPRTHGAGQEEVAEDFIPLCTECHDLYHHDWVDFTITYLNQIMKYFYNFRNAFYNLKKALLGEKK